MSIIKTRFTAIEQRNEAFTWLRQKEIHYAVHSINSQRTHLAPHADAYFTISDKLVALEFMLRFDGVLVPEDEYNHI